MSLMNNYISWFLIGTVASVGPAFVAGEAIAQTAPSTSADRLGTDDDGGSVDPFQIFHDAILAPSMSNGEFAERQNRAITSEAESFRQRQQDAFRQGVPEVTDEAVETDENIEGDLL